MAIFLGTEATVGAGTLKLDFPHGALQYSRVATLAPDQLFTFSLGLFASANQVWITNIAPDPPGVNNLATITLIDAAALPGDAPVPEPATLILIGSGLAAAFARRRSTARHGGGQAARNPDAFNVG